MTDRYCTNCGHGLNADSRFCPNCGRPVHEVAEVPTPEADVDVPPPPSSPSGAWQPAGPQSGASEPGWPRRHPLLTGCLGFIGLFFLLGIIGAALGGGGDETATGGGGGGDVSQQDQGAGSQESGRDEGDPGEAQQAAPEEDPEPESEPEPEPEPEHPQFSDGIYQVGADIEPGTYRTREGSSGCYYARLAGFSNELNDLLANANTDAPAIVTIKQTDAGFESQGCGTWTKDLSAITQSKTSFDEGIYIVGTDIQSGTYRSTGSSGCYYARLRNFTADLNSIIANGNADAPVVVTIAPTDAGFESHDCGTWTRLE